MCAGWNRLLDTAGSANLDDQPNIPATKDAGVVLVVFTSVPPDMDGQFAAGEVVAMERADFERVRALGVARTATQEEIEGPDEPPMRTALDRLNRTRSAWKERLAIK